MSSASTMSDPAKLMQLFDKIEKSNNLEIEERSIKNLHQKLSHKLVDTSTLVNNHSQDIGKLLGWVERRHGQCSDQAMLQILQIFKFLSQKIEGIQLMNTYGCVQFFSDLIKKVKNDDMTQTLDFILRALISGQQEMSSQTSVQGTQIQQQTMGVTQNPFASQNLAKTEINTLKPNVRTGIQQESAFAQNSSQLGLAQIPERDDDPLGDDNMMNQSMKSNGWNQSMQKQNVSSLTFNKKDFKITTTGAISQQSLQQQTPQINSLDNAHMEIMKKQMVLKEQCDLPYIVLSEEDEKLIFDLSVQLKFGDFKTVMMACQKLQNLTFFDFPIETFLQRADIIKALLDLVEGSQGFVYTNLAQKALLIFVQRLKYLYQYLGNNINKPSYLQQNERDSTIPNELYIENSYPVNHLQKWVNSDQIGDIKKFGYSSRSQNAVTATIHNSLSCRAVIGLVITKTINLLKDSEKIGLYIQLINEAFDTFLFVFNVIENDEFTELIHLFLFAFDSVFEFYKEQVFNDILIKPIIPLCTNFIKLLNLIPLTEDQYKMPFTNVFFKNTENLQMTLRRFIFRNDSDQISRESDIILDFFKRLEQELPNQNLLQKNVIQIHQRSQEVYKKFINIQNFKLNAKSFFDDDKNGGMVFVESLTQFYQSIDILNELSYCLELKLDFPFENILLDCMVFSILAEESSLDARLDQVEILFQTYIHYHIPEVRERVLRRLYQKIKMANALQISNNKEVNNNVLLSKFIYKKAVLIQLVNGILINSEVAQEDSKLQLTIGQLVIKILIIAYNEGGFISQKGNLNSYLLTFQSLMPTYSDLIGLIDLIEENSQRNCRYQRLLRDLFNQDQGKREFATSVLKTSFSKDSINEMIQDVLKSAIDIKNPCSEVTYELEAINQNYDYSTFDLPNITAILMSQNSDFVVKKSCLEQLTMLIFDINSKKGRTLLKPNTNLKDVFTFVVDEILNTFNTCQSYLRSQISLLDSSQVNYLNECLKFVFFCYLFYNDDTLVSSFFGKIRLMSLPKEKQDQNVQLQQYTSFLNCLVFLLGSSSLRKNTLRLLFVSVFHPLWLCTKILRQPIKGGQVRKSLALVMPSFCQNAFVMIVPIHIQSIKQPPREELILTDEMRLYIESRLNLTDEQIAERQTLKSVSQNFITVVDSKRDDYNKIMRSFETLQNHVLATESLNDELIHSASINKIVDLLKVLPTRDYEYNFLSDFFMSINQMLHQHQKFKNLQNLELLLSGLADAFKFHQVPYLVETGISCLEDYENNNSFYSVAKLNFIARFYESLTLWTQIDQKLVKQLKCPSALQDKIFTSSFVNYMLESYHFLSKTPEQQRKILCIISLMVSGYDIKRFNFEQLPQLLQSTIAQQKLTQGFQESSIIMQCMRQLIYLHEHRLFFFQNQGNNNDVEVSVNLTQTSKNYLQKFQSFGWLIRFTESRDSRVRCLCWDLLTTVFNYAFLRAHSSVLQTGINTFLKHQELYCVKISALRFLNKACEALIHNCDVTREDQENIDEQNFVGSQSEHFTIKSLLQTITKQGLISQIHSMLSQRDFPLMFLILTLKLIHKLILMDYKKSLSVLSQLDYWTFLIELMDINILKQIETHESRRVLKASRDQIIRYEDPTQMQDIVYLSINSMLDFLFESLKKDSSLANQLVKTSKMMPNLFKIIETMIKAFSKNEMKLTNKSIIVILVDKIVKLLHIVLLHPKDYSLSLITQFLFQKQVALSQNEEQRNWVYLIAMFNIVNDVSKSSYYFGHVDVKLSICRFIAELLLRIKSSQDNFLDETVRHFQAEKLHNNQIGDQDLESYGELLLLEFGSVFKVLYIDKNASRQSPDAETLAEQENSRIDICMCLSVLLASCNSAKVAAIENNLVKKVIEICLEHVSILNLDSLQKYTIQSSGGPTKSVMNKSKITTINQSVMAAQQLQRKNKYASQTDDAELSEREVLRMLEIINHLFYGAGHLLIGILFPADKVAFQQSSMVSTMNSQSRQKKQENSLSDKLVGLFFTLIDDFGSNSRYEQILHETLKTTITFASQNVKFKNAFLFAISSQQTQNKKIPLIKLICDKLQSENFNSNSIKMKLMLILLKTLSMSAEVAKELMKNKFLDDVLGKLLPLCKNEKDIKLMKNYLNGFTGFLAAYASTIEGQKILLSLKQLYEVILFILNTITNSASQTLNEKTTLNNIVVHCLLFIRNTTFTRTNKLHFLSNQDFLPCLLACISSAEQPPKIKAYATACLWILLFNHQGVKAVLNSEHVVNELQLIRQEYQRSTDIGNYALYIDNANKKQEAAESAGGSMSEKQENEKQNLERKSMNSFTLTALNGIMNLLQTQDQMKQQN